VARYRQHFNPFVQRLSIAVLRDDPQLDDLVILAAGCLVAAIEGRQRRLSPGRRRGGEPCPSHAVDRLVRSQGDPPVLPSLAVIALLAAQPDAALAPLDAARGYKPLTGPNATSAWRGYKQASFPAKGWTLRDGVLTHAAGGGGGDIITTDQFGDFDFVFQFRTAPKANSGVIYGVAEKHDTAWQTGPEFQVIDDAGNDLKPGDPHSTGAMYDLYPPAAAKTMKAAGEWNDGRIYYRNGVIQHWVNGAKVVDARLFDAPGYHTKDWQARILGSKFAAYEGFGHQAKGHIALQDHGDEVSYRSVRVRDLSAAAPGERQLFNGKDLTGLVAVVPDAAKSGIKPEDVWTVKDGVLVCKGSPAGYIRTKDSYANYILRVEWRWAVQPGNSGVLLRMSGEDKVWPKSFEAQLHSGNAGDIIGIGDFPYKGDPSRTSGRRTAHTHGAERPAGEWNEYEIIMNRGEAILLVNGEELNRATGVEEVAGPIAFQSEGAEIHFRGIRLIPLN
jgi:hypothetical protein